VVVIVVRGVEKDVGVDVTVVVVDVSEVLVVSLSTVVEMIRSDTTVVPDETVTVETDDCVAPANWTVDVAAFVDIVEVCVVVLMTYAVGVVVV